ncbi:MAG TPA: ParA family protein [Candidatus Binatia bacterium]|nr:ParA family protein [Candidatus Binatia bacterium]
MEKLAILGEKGGGGKSTTALGLAVAFALAGKEVAVIDLDPQATAAKWSDRRGKDFPAVVSCQVSRLDITPFGADSWNINSCLRDRLVGRLRHTCPV